MTPLECNHIQPTGGLDGTGKRIEDFLKIILDGYFFGIGVFYYPTQSWSVQRWVAEASAAAMAHGLDGAQGRTAGLKFK